MSDAERDFVAQLFQDWLGEDLYDATVVPRYLDVYDKLLRAVRGALPASWSQFQRLYHTTSRWPAFVAAADGFAARSLAPLSSNGGEHLVAFPTSRPRSRSPQFESTELRERLNVNLATAAELAALPGLGPVTSARIVARRRRRGYLRKPEDLSGLEGLGKAELERALPFLSFIEPSAGALAPTIVEGNVAEPVTFVAYVRFLYRTGLRPAVARPTFETPSLSPSLRRLAVTELERLAEAMARAPFWEECRRADVPELDQATRAERRVRSLEESGADRIKGVSPVRNSRYLDLARALIQAARECVYLEMFFFTTGPSSSPGRLLLDDLKAARARGVDVRVVLDADLPEDYHQASTINAETERLLRESGVDCRNDTLGVTTHGKSLIVDADQLLVGSHNWTASSMFVRDETSLYLEGAELADRARARFLAVWDQVDPDPERRKVAFSLLRFLVGDEGARLAQANFQDSRSFLAEHPDAASIAASAVRFSIAEARLVRFRRVLRFMQDLAFPEPTAWALALIELETPAEFFAMQRAEVLRRLQKLPSLSGPYQGARIRYDIVEAARA